MVERLVSNADSHQLRTPPRFSQRFHDVLGRESSHDQGQIRSESCLDGFPIDPLNVLNATTTSTIHFHHKFYVLHKLSVGCAIPVEEESRWDDRLPSRDFSLQAVVCISFR